VQRLISFILICFAAEQLSAQGFPTLERILLPVFAGPSPGAFGSLWTSELWIYNDDDEPAGVGYLFPPDTGQIAPKSSRSGVGNGPGYSPARFITVLASQAPRLQFNLRIRDLSRQAQTAGTEIPVVRESKFRSGRVILLNVPIDARFRQTLRLYEFLETGQRPGSVLVRFFRIGSPPDALVHEEGLTLAGPSSVVAYAQLGPFPPELFDASTVRIEIEPVTPNMRYWGFVSITNNETQHVTTVTPQ